MFFFITLGWRSFEKNLLQIGDQILKVNGQPISDQNNFFNALRFAPPVARLTIIRWAADLDLLRSSSWYFIYCSFYAE